MNLKIAVSPLLLTLVAVSTSYAAPIAVAPIAGGYAPTSVSKPDIKLAAKAAVMQHGAKEKKSIKLVAIERAEQQVVAGVNYRMTLKIKHGKIKHGAKAERAKAERVKAVVYKNLQGKFALSSWEKTK